MPSSYYAAMKTKEIIDIIKEQGVAEEVWLGLNLAKLRSIIELQTGVNFLDNGSLHPRMVSDAMNMCLYYLAQEIIERKQVRN